MVISFSPSYVRSVSAPRGLRPQVQLELPALLSSRVMLNDELGVDLCFDLIARRR
jgi:hypothetical protein